MRLVLQARDGRKAEITVDPSDTVDTALFIAEAELGVSAASARLVRPGRGALRPDATFAAQGVADGEVLHVEDASRAPAQDLQQQVANLFGNPAQPSPQPQGAPAGQAAPPADLRDQVAALFSAPAPQQVLDPDDPEVQRRAYEAIQAKEREENLARALEHTPEAFSRVVMLYVRCEVNKVALPGFVDSGAQMTIMSENMAERCNLTRLIDTKFQGVAKGVGTSKIIGRIHMAMVNLGGVFLPMSITVLEGQGMDFLIGLDQLKRHQMAIDLRKSVLRFGDDGDVTELPFLSEHELPENIRLGEVSALGADDDQPPPAEADPPSTASPAPAPAPAGLTPEQAQKVQTVAEFTQQPPAAAKHALEACGWDVDTAVAMLAA